MFIPRKNLFSFIKDFLPNNPVIVEAGAFTGKDTIQLAQIWPDSIIHAFEPVPQIYQELCCTTKSFANICTYQLALGTQKGNAQFYLSEHPNRPGKICQAGTLLKPKERLNWSSITYNQTITVPTITLDGWAYDYKIDYIDALWLDLQGHELAVLQSCPQLLKTIHLIYIEVHFIQAYEGQPHYQQVNTWLISQGFTPIAQDFTNETDWFFGNVIYIKK